jgi:hypothetical protein
LAFRKNWNAGEVLPGEKKEENKRLGLVKRIIKKKETVAKSLIWRWRLFCTLKNRRESLSHLGKPTAGVTVRLFVWYIQKVLD